MSSEFEDAEPSLKLEEVERRGEPRGILHGITACTDGGPELDVLEASRKGIFIAVEDPESYRLGAALEATITGSRGGSDSVSLACRVEVARKEIHPRRGVALRIMQISPLAEEQLKALVRA